MSYNFIDKSQTFAGFSFSKELKLQFEAVISEIPGRLHGNPSETQPRTSFTPLLEMMEYCNGMTITRNEVNRLNAEMQRYSYSGSDKWFCHSEFINVYLQSVFKTDNPSFIGLTKSPDVPSSALSYINTHTWVNNSWRNFIAQIGADYFKELTESECNELKSQFVMLSRQAFEWLAINEPSDIGDYTAEAHLMFNDEMHDYIREYTRQSFHNPRTMHFEALFDNSRFQILDELGFDNSVFNVDWIMVFKINDVTKPERRKFSRGIKAITNSMMLWYPLLGAVHAIREKKNEFKLSDLGIYHAGGLSGIINKAIQVEDLKWTLNKTMSEWQGGTFHPDNTEYSTSFDCYFWSSYRRDCEVIQTSLFKNEEAKAAKARIIEVRGSDIAKFYHEDSICSDAPRGSLGASCMRHDNLQKCITFYEKAAASLLVALGSNGKVLGRAVLWRNARIQPHYVRDIRKEQPCKMIDFMDRVYYSHEWIKPMFVDYAKTHGFYRKRYQNYEEQTAVVEPNGDYINARMNIMLPKKFDYLFQYFPFVDTFHYFDVQNKMLSNHNDVLSYSSYFADHKRLGGTFRLSSQDNGMKDGFHSIDFNREFVKEKPIDTDKDKLWNLRGTQMRPSNSYCFYENRMRSVQMTNLFGWVGSPYRAYLFDSSGKLTREMVPPKYSWYSGNLDKNFLRYHKVRGQWVEYSDEEFFINEGQYVDFPNGESIRKVPKMAARYCPGFNSLVTLNQWGGDGLNSNAKLFKDNKIISVSKAYVNYCKYISDEDYYDVLSSSSAEKIQTYNETNADALVFSQRLDCYLHLMDSLYVKGFGFVSKSMIGAYADSVVTKFQHFQSRILEKNDSSKVKHVKVKVPTEIQNLITL